MRLFTIAVLLATVVLLPEESDGQITLNTDTALLGLGGVLLAAGAFKTGFYLARQNSGSRVSPYQGRHYHHHPRPYWGRRRRRSDEARTQNGIVINEEILEMLESVLRTDEDKCTLLLTCHVASLDPETLTPQMLSLLLPFIGEVKNTSSAYGYYKEAVMRGQTGDSCIKTYRSCKEAPEELLEKFFKSVPAGLDLQPQPQG